MKAIRMIFTLIICFNLTNSSYATEKVYIDKQGVIRWTDSNHEVALFGANYCLPSACDYRAAKNMSDNLKTDIEVDMAHFSRMGWDGLRVCFWGDFQNTDSLGNLVKNDHLDLMDYLIYIAGKRGISMLLSPIVTYSSQWPDAMHEPAIGFSTYFKKSELGTNPDAIKAQANYIQQLLNHKNPYTGLRIKDDPNILFVEMINEPAHHPDDFEGSVKYINALTEAVRSTGCNKLVFHNLSQSFEMAKPISESNIQGVSFAWYPSGLNSGHTLHGNYLPTVDHYEPMKNKFIEKMPRIVYEFDQPDLLSPAMYPAMVRTFRSVGAQFVAMFSYDMLSTAKANLGWQTHFLNMVYTPQKAIGAIIASEAMETLPLYKEYGSYPENCKFGNITIEGESGYSQFLSDEKFIYSGSTETMPPNIKTLKHIVGYGQSSVVDYDGKGIYFLDKVEDGCWRLEVYPDAIFVNDPFEQMSPEKTVSRIVYNAWDMQIDLPDLERDFEIRDLKNENKSVMEANNGKFIIEPGIYTLTQKNQQVSFPEKIENVGFYEFYAPLEENEPISFIHQAPKTARKGMRTLLATVVSNNAPDSVEIYLRNVSGYFKKFQMKKNGYEYSLDYDFENAGFYEYCITVYDGSKKTTFPGKSNKTPHDWAFTSKNFWRLHVLNNDEPMSIFNPIEDVDQISFSRIGDGYRSGVFQLVTTSVSEDGAIQVSLPSHLDKKLKDYTAAVNITKKIAAINTGETKSIEVLARGLHKSDRFYLTLVESDGTCWSKELVLSSEWEPITINLDEFTPGKGVMLPQGYPGNWNYWFSTPPQRGNNNDQLQLQKVQQLQFSVRADGNQSKEINTIQIAGVKLNF